MKLSYGAEQQTAGYLNQMQKELLNMKEEMERMIRKFKRNDL